MTRVALASPYTLPLYCGNSIMAERLRQALQQRGYDVSVFNTSQDTSAAAITFAPHILHSLNADKSFQWARTFAAINPAPWVITLTGTDYNTWYRIKEPPAHIQESLAKADALVVFHRGVFDALSNKVSLPAKKIHIIPQGVPFFHNLGDAGMLRQKNRIAPESIVFVMVAGIRPVKNLALGIKAFSRVVSRVPQATLVLIGPAMDRLEADHILALGKKLNCFTYLGQKSPLEVRELMAAADVFLNTSLHEGMSGSLLEAMAQGLPILASANAGNRALVRDGENGLLFSVGDQGGLTRAAIKLAADKFLRKRLGEAGRRFIAAYHSVEQEIDRYDRLYSGLLDR